MIIENQNINDVVVPSALTINRENLTIATDQDFYLVASVLPENATNYTITWTSSNPNIASVCDGYVAPHSLGTVEITASIDACNLSARCVVVVIPAVPVTKVGIIPNKKAITAGESIYLDAIFQPLDATCKFVRWSSSNSEIATVNPDSGQVFAQREGVVTIYATACDGCGAMDSYELFVAKPVVVISCEPDAWVFSSRTMGADMAEAIGKPEQYRVDCPDTALAFEASWRNSAYCVVVHTHGSPEGLFNEGFDPVENQNTTPVIIHLNDIKTLTRNNDIMFVMITACETAGGEEEDNVACWLSKKINPNGIVLANYYFGYGADKEFTGVKAGSEIPEDGWRVYRNGIRVNMPKVLTMEKSYRIYKLFTER